MNINVQYTRVSQNGLYALRESDMPTINKLLRDITKTTPLRTLNDVHELLTHGGILVLAHHLRQQRRIIGMGTLIVAVKLASGRHGIIEDLVVDDSMRRKGIGEGIMEELIAHARRYNLTHLDLTTKPKRIEANALYTKLGFEPRPTNPYRLMLK